MSLRQALSILPDDRDSVAAARKVVSYLDRHQRESADAVRIAGAIGLAAARVEPVIAALRQAHVVDCDGEIGTGPVRYAPDAVLGLEVRRFLQASNDVSAGLQRRVDRFRGSYGR